MRIRSLVLFIMCGALLTPALVFSQDCPECNGPITEIIQPGHRTPIIFELQYIDKPGPSTPPLPPIIQDPKIGVFRLTNSGNPNIAEGKALSGNTSLGTSSMPMGSMATPTSQTERLLKMIESAIKKLK